MFGPPAVWRFGASGARWLYCGLTVAALAAALAAIAYRALPLWFAAAAVLFAGSDFGAVPQISCEREPLRVDIPVDGGTGLRGLRLWIETRFRRRPYRRTHSRPE